MVSETSICNQALGWIGQDPINSLADNTDVGQWMRNNYPFLRDAVLEERMWTFATARATSTTADLDPFGAQFMHPKPLDWISVFRVYRTINSGHPESWIKSDGWRMEDGNVLANEGTVFLWGIRRVTDTGAFSPLFTQALAARIAFDAAIPFTENRQLQADMGSLYAAKLADATVRDGQQGSNETIQSNTLINARYAGGGGLR
jgi:hypothetical protein